MFYDAYPWFQQKHKYTVSHIWFLWNPVAQFSLMMCSHSSGTCLFSEIIITLQGFMIAACSKSWFLTIAHFTASFSSPYSLHRSISAGRVLFRERSSHFRMKVSSPSGCVRKVSFLILPARCSGTFQALLQSLSVLCLLSLVASKAWMFPILKRPVYTSFIYWSTWSSLWTSNTNSSV